MAAPPLTWRLTDLLERPVAGPLSRFGGRLQDLVARHEKFFKKHAHTIGSLVALPFIGLVYWTFPIIERTFPDSDSRFFLEVLVVVPPFFVFSVLVRYLFDE